MSKPLLRSTNNKVVAGRCGGLGDYFDLDPTIVRLIAVVSFFASAGTVVVGYIIGMIIIPKNYNISSEPTPPGEQSVKPSTSLGWQSIFPGLALIGLGLLILFEQYCYWFGFGDIWPILLILIGGGMIAYHALRPSITSEKLNANGNATEHNGGGLS